jgi:hypothetical protein
MTGASFHGKFAIVSQFIFLFYCVLIISMLFLSNSMTEEKVETSTVS